MSSVFRERVLQGGALASPSPLALEVLRVARCENSSVDDLLRLIESDAVLSARILAVVNSSFYGLRQKILSLRQAMLALGLRSLRVMALSFSLVDTVRNEGRDDRLDYPRYWRRSLTTAVGSRLMARHRAPDLAEDAFTCGLVADLGLVAAWRTASDEYAPILECARAEGRPLCEAEQSAFGCTHADIGAELLRRWGLPQPMPDVVEVHHRTDAAQLSGPAAELARIVQLAARVAAMVTGDEPPAGWPTLRDEMMRTISLTTETLDQLLGALDHQVSEAAALFKVAPSAGLMAGSLRGDAAVCLAEISVTTELERRDAVRAAHEAEDRLNRAREVSQRFLKAALTDALTGLSNRGAFDKQVREEWKRSQAQEAPLALLLLDIDQFKLINDAHGHAAGDRVMQAVAERVVALLDAESHAARYGGDEFAILMPGVSTNQLNAWGERMRNAVAECQVAQGGELISVTVSVGAAWVQRAEGEGPEALIQAADAALYRAKHNGRNCYELARGLGAAQGASWIGKLRRLVRKPPTEDVRK